MCVIVSSSQFSVFICCFMCHFCATTYKIASSSFVYVNNVEILSENSGVSEIIIIYIRMGVTCTCEYDLLKN